MNETWKRHGSYMPSESTEIFVTAPSITVSAPRSLSLPLLWAIVDMGGRRLPIRTVPTARFSLPDLGQLIVASYDKEL